MRRLAPTAAFLLAPTLVWAQDPCTTIRGNIVENCGFEGATFVDSTFGVEPGQYAVTTPDPGTASGGVTSIYSLAGDNQFVFSGGWPYNRGPYNGVTLSQTLATTPGQSYAIGFDASEINSAGVFNPYSRLTVTFGADTVFNHSLGDDRYDPTPFPAFYVAPGALTTLSIMGADSGGLILLDNLVVREAEPSVTTTPEPSTVALVLGGLAVLGVGARRRQLNEDK